MSNKVKLNRLFRLANLLIAAVVIPMVLFAAWKRPAHREGYFGQLLSPAKEAYDFKLTDQDGKPFRLSQLRGDAVVLAFGFTHCPNICPTTLASLASVFKALPSDDRARVRFLFISVDPARDTPEKLKNYVPFFQSSFVGLTGSVQEIARTAKEYGAFYETVPQSSNDASDFYTINHSSYVYVIDPAGKFALLYHYEQLPESKRIAHDIAKLLHDSDSK